MLYRGAILGFSAPFVFFRPRERLFLYKLVTRFRLASKTTAWSGYSRRRCVATMNISQRLLRKAMDLTTKVCLNEMLKDMRMLTQGVGFSYKILNIGKGV